MTLPASLHIVGSKTLGGAERFYLRLIDALHRRQAPVQAVIRTASEVAACLPGGIPWHALPLRSVWDPLSRYEVRRLVHRLRPDIVQTYMGRATRCTHLERNGPVHIARLGGYYKLGGYRHAHDWVCNTRGLCDYLVSNGFPARRVHHIPNFIEPPRNIGPDERRALRDGLGLGTDDLVLISAGRFVQVKGYRYLIEALARLPRDIEGRRLRLLLLGDGPDRAALQAQADALGVTERIVWAGWQMEPGPFFAIADLVVFPSLERETLGNVILEAWAWGRPLVTARFRGAVEITAHGEDAWQVPCADAAALARGIFTVARDARLAQRMVGAGARKLQERFSETAVVDRYLELYDQLLSGRAR